ncbi:MAG TPA: DUF4382 domain-containing protein [Flavipsychrobacter sp.]|nr:DUF4382 domain-containing protein [Flavipsychrobacter sp.]
MKKMLFTMVLFCTSVFTLLSCKKDKDENQNTAVLSLRLTDGPAPYEHVYIDIQQVMVTMEGSAAISIIPIRPGIYDLLQFRNGADTLLAEARVPAGKVSQIRLILGENNAVVVNGTSYPMSTPSAQESGLKLNLKETLAPNGSYVFWIDFDAGKSIVQTGNGGYKLKPVIRAYSALTDGRLKGYIAPLNAMATVYAINNGDTLSAIPAPNGFFMFTGMPAGIYTIWIEPGIPVLQPAMINNVKIEYGVETDLGTILLP